MSTPQPSFSELLDWCEGRLPADRAARVEALVAETDSEDVLATVAWIRGFHRDRALMPLQSVPEELSDRLQSLFRERQRPWDATGYLGSDTVTDSRNLPAAAGFRGSRRTGAVEARRVVVRRGEVSVSLEVTDHTAEGLALTGSVQRSASNDSWRPVPAAVVTLTRQGTVSRRLRCDGEGTFHAALVPADVDEVWVDAGEGFRFRAEVGLTLR